MHNINFFMEIVMQETVTLVSLILMVGLIGVFIFVAKNASTNVGDYQQVQNKAYKIRSKFFFLLLIVGAPITLVTLVDLPYAATRGETGDVTKTIDVEGYQWYWKVSDNEAQVGDTILFRVTTGDVSHGLGIYDEDLKLIGQTQAMPGYTNSLKLTFDKAGTYQFLCLEYCGVAHHAMISELIVK